MYLSHDSYLSIFRQLLADVEESVQQPFDTKQYELLYKHIWDISNAMPQREYTLVFEDMRVALIQLRHWMAKDNVRRCREMEARYA